MNRRGKVRKLFPGGNTTMGFYSFYDNIIHPEANRIFIIKGGPGVGKSTFMKKVGIDMVNRGYDVEYHYCSSDNDSLDALVIPKLNVALMDGTAPHIIEPKNPGVVDEIINFGDNWDENELLQHKDDIISTNKKISKQFKIAFSLLREAKVAYDEWKSYIEDGFDNYKYINMIKELKKDIFKCIDNNEINNKKSRHLFSSAITPGGCKNYIDTLIEGDMKVYALKGSPGSCVKETIASVAKTAEELGMFTEQLHCPFEPEYLDLVIIHDIKTVVINITQPFHFDISRIDDSQIMKIIDLDDFVDNKIFIEYKSEIKDAKHRVKLLIEKAVEHIGKAKTLHDIVEKYYVSSMNFKEIDIKRMEIMKKVFRYDPNYYD